MKKGSFFLFVLTVLFITTHGSAFAFNSPLQFGWVIGIDGNNTTVILHTKNGGQTWQVQVDNPEWKGYNDISAVDRRTAWAALGDASGHGVILHTSNGGATWNEQTLPEGVDIIKNIRGLTRHEVWAVSLEGTILHTTDGGKEWNIVPLGIVDSGIEMIVNRMDTIGYRRVPIADNSGRNTEMIYANVWFVDENGYDYGMIHSLYNGDIWRKEYIPNDISGSGGHMVSAYSPRVVWAAKWYDGHLYRTVDGGENWYSIPGINVGGNDIDDMCAYSADALWFVQFEATPTGAGYIHHVSLEGGAPDLKTFQPFDKLPYKYEGLTCVDDQTAVVVGYTDVHDLSPKGIILLTNDAGQNWVRQPLPVDDVRFWKVSFVGARR